MSLIKPLCPYLAWQWEPVRIRSKMEPAEVIKIWRKRREAARARYKGRNIDRHIYETGLDNPYASALAIKVLCNSLDRTRKSNQSRVGIPEQTRRP